MSGRPPGLSIKAPEKTIEERIAVQEEVQKKLMGKQKKYAQTLKNIREGKYAKNSLGNNSKYHIIESKKRKRNNNNNNSDNSKYHIIESKKRKRNNNNNNSDNNNYSNAEEINISRWTVIPSEEEEGGEFLDVPITPSPLLRLKRTPPRLNRTLKRKTANASTNSNNGPPPIKRLKYSFSADKSQRRRKQRRTQRKSSRRYN
jgi:hypothetical protein